MTAGAQRGSGAFDVRFRARDEKPHGSPSVKEAGARSRLELATGIGADAGGIGGGARPRALGGAGGRRPWAPAPTMQHPPLQPPPPPQPPPARRPPDLREHPP